MARETRLPVLYDKVLQITTTMLKRGCYLNPVQIKTGLLSWSFLGVTNSITVLVNTKEEQPYMELRYNYRGSPLHYKINLTFVKSPIRGQILYFVCPVTNKRCRKLYFINGYFLHREAVKGCMYEIQTKSKRQRQRDKVLNGLFSEEILSGNPIQKTYAGKPTRRYLRANKKVQRTFDTLLQQK